MTRVGLWYATGPADRPYSENDPAFNKHVVVSDLSDIPNCVTVENAGGVRFPVHVDLIDEIAGR